MQLAKQREGLSIQSGDIVRTERKIEDPNAGALYTFLFPKLHRVIRVVFCHPACSLVAIIVLSVATVLIGVLVLVLLPPTLNFSLRSFQAPSHISAIRWDAFRAAENGYFTFDVGGPTSGKRSLAGDDALPSKRAAGDVWPFCQSTYQTQRTMHAYWALSLVYLAPKNSPDQNVFSRLDQIYEIEQHIYNDAHYRYFCHKCLTCSSDDCDPVNSVLTYFYNDKRLPNSGLVRDTRARLISIMAEAPSSVLWYTGGKLYNYTSTLLRSEVRIGIPLPCYELQNLEEQHGLVQAFFLSFIPYLEKASSGDLEVLYGGTDLVNYAVDQAVEHDAKLSSASFVMVLITVFLLSNFSISATIISLLAIGGSFPWAFLTYRLPFGFETLGIMNVVSLFVIIGIGVDDVFVYLNTFKQTRDLQGLDTFHKRLTHTVILAGKATFYTSISTAVAFFANAVSMIPAIQQFGVFMGLVVISCFVSVSLLMPLYLHIWHYWLSAVESKLFSFCCCQYCRRKKVGLSVRMSVVINGSDGSPDHNGGSPDHDSGPDHCSEDSNSDNGMDDVMGDVMGDVKGDVTTELIPLPSAPSVTPTPSSSPAPIMDRLSLALQKFLLLFVARPVLCLRAIDPKMACVPCSRVRQCIVWLLRCSVLWMFLLVFVVSLTTASYLREADKPPQFLSEGSNTQRLLDLAGNLSSSEDNSRWMYSSWYTSLTTPTSSPITSTPVTMTPTTPTRTTGSSPPTSQTTSRPTDSTSPTGSTGSTAPTGSTGSTAPTGSTGSTAPPTGSTGSVMTTGPITDPPTVPSTPSGSYDVTKFSNNAVVYVVFGIKDVLRSYSTTHVLPQEGFGNSAVVDLKFSDTLRCPIPSVSKVTGTMRALCRLCANLSNPSNGLVLLNGAECVPSGLLQSSLSCLLPVVISMPECSNLLLQADALEAKYNYNSSTNRLVFLAMAFRSTTFVSGSPYHSHMLYTKWDNFLSAEMDAIGQDSVRYPGAKEALSTAYQTSEHWVEINVVVLAVYGSLYSIVLAFAFCSVLVVLLSRDFRVVVSILLTIAGILATLLALFKLFGWTLGVVEAVALSILVGNSLDYCIHLTEGYMSMDARHLAFVDKFLTWGVGSVRVRRAAGAISLTGVSIVSSALTTILATLPLLATEIQLFARFGEILVLNTLVTLIYSVVLCATFLSLWGPVHSRCTCCSWVNAILTISLTLGGYVLVIVAMRIAALYGVEIPSPVGGALF